ncbi:MAG TPA: class II aldolase/adducin family protein [Candidatus Lokiarchaeia archaeon]|nr:class II aldolase/adducin family protein [Candidatus Lokiarchaeia archaeon]
MLSLRESILPILEEMMVFIGGEIPIAPFGYANTFDLAEKVTNALGTVNAVLMANYGPVVVARTMDKVIKNAELVEKLALLYHGASHRGKPFILDDPSDLEYFQKIFEEENATC